MFRFCSLIVWLFLLKVTSKSVFGLNQDFLHKNALRSFPKYGTDDLVELVELHNHNEDMKKQEPETSMWFGPDLGKRDKRELAIEMPQNLSNEDQNTNFVIVLPLSKFFTREQLPMIPRSGRSTKTKQKQTNMAEIMNPRLGRSPPEKFANAELKMNQLLVPRYGRSSSLPFFVPRLGRSGGADSYYYDQIFN